MPEANRSPIYTATPRNASNGTTGMAPTLTAAANDYTGVSANNKEVFRAGSAGSFVQRLRFKAIGTNVATVARVYLNNGSVNTTAANNTFIGEVYLPATTASAVAATPDIDYPLNIALQAGFSLYVGLATAVSAGWVVAPIGGDY